MQKIHHVMQTYFASAIKLLSVVAAAFLLLSCDPGFDEDMVIRNQSQHSVTVIPSPYYYYNQELDSTFIHESESFTIATGDSVIVSNDGGIGSASRDNAIHCFQNYYNDSVTLRFDDGLQAIYHSYDTTGISPYNFASSNYSYSEKLKEKGLYFRNHPYYGRMTFTITEAHHAEAQ